jgi:Tfp pilus assembly PilM family ATPase
LIIPKLEELTLEIKRSLSFFNTRFGEKNEKPIYLVFSGGGAGIKGLVPYMEANTGISSIRNQYVLQLCEYDKAQFKETYLQTMAPIFSIASGLALLDIEERYMRKAAKVLAEKRKAEEKNFENGIKKIEKSEIIDENKVIS